jgi:16S rRNA (cytosine967-C5)-methyltransferase
VSHAGETSRRVALEALLRIEDGSYAHILVPQLLRQRHLSSRDRALVTDLVYGSVRMRGLIDHLISQVANRPIEKLDAPVRAALRLGTYQLMIGIPAHAAVGETVGVVDARARGFVNGVLRGVARAGPPWKLPEGDDVHSVSIRTSHPTWVVQTLVDEFGADDAHATLAVDNEAPPVTLRVNTLRTTVDAAIVELRAAGLEVEAGTLVPDALVVRHTGDLAALAAIAEGRVTPQDQTSQAIIAALDPQPGDRVLDLASAPGGKASAAAERMGGEGLIVASDLHPGRVRTVARAAARLGFEHVIRPVIADGRCPPVRDASFDRVLLDAPCSGLGVLRRRPDARWRVQPEDVHELAALQRVLLAAAARAVRPGGRLVYAVCTLTRDETNAIDEWAAEALPNLVAHARPGAPWRPHGRGAILLPSDARTDGMFVVVYERVAAAADVPPATAAARSQHPSAGWTRWGR